MPDLSDNVADGKQLARLVADIQQFLLNGRRHRVSMGTTNQRYTARRWTYLHTHIQNELITLTMHCSGNNVATVLMDMLAVCSLMMLAVCNDSTVELSMV